MPTVSGNRVIFEDGRGSAQDPSSYTKLSGPGVYDPPAPRFEKPVDTPKYSAGNQPPWMYQGEDGQWYSDYDPSAPVRPGGGQRWTDSNPYALPMGNTFQTMKLPEATPDPVIPTAPMAKLGTIRNAPKLGAPREDNRSTKARFRTSTTSGLPLIGKGV